MYTQETLVSISIHPKSQYIVASTNRNGQFISRLVVLEVNSNLKKINELNYIKFTHSYLAQKVSSYLRTLKFFHLWEGSNPLLFGYQLAGDNMLLVYQVKDAKLEKVQKNICISNGAVIDCATIGINLFSICEGGCLSRVQLV